MINISPAGWLLFLFIVMLSSTAGILLSRLMPWGQSARNVGLDIASGLVLGAFLPGFAAVLVLGLWPGTSHMYHLALILGQLSLVMLIGWGCHFLKYKMLNPIPPLIWKQRGKTSTIEKLIMTAVVLLLLISVFAPLIQNDSLEYSIVARELFNTRSLVSYPLIDPDNNGSGFFGPWTHPPLYVSLLYFVELIQGHADSPGAIRLVAPWFALSCAVLVYSTGHLINKKTGQIAALLFLSTPLFFLGAGSALLDPLPIAGMTLMTALVIGLQTGPILLGLIVGLATGLALWTHSQALLILPIALAIIAASYGLRHWRQAVIACAVLLFATVLVSFWPYWRNYMIFGTPISDNPAVFALPSLHWDDYFNAGRGLGTLAAKIQYGLLKGWFVPDAYGFVFWFAVIGILFSISRIGEWIKHIFSIKKEISINRITDIRFILSLILAIYFTGVAVSMLLGIDLMIRNERYFLLILPAASVIAGYGLAGIFSAGARYYAHRYPRPNRGPAILSMRMHRIFYSLIGLQLAFLCLYTVISKKVGTAGLESDLAKTLANLPEINTIQKMNELKQINSPVFTLRPSDMYYSNKRQVSYLDPRMIELYGKTNTDESLKILEKLNIKYIHSSPYTLPPYYNSQIQAILSEPSSSTLMIDERGTQIYKLGNSGLRRGKPMNLSPLVRKWRGRTYFVFAGRGARNKKGYLPVSFESNLTDEINSTHLFGLFHRNLIMISEIGNEADPVREELITVTPGTEYVLDISVAGRGAIRISIDRFFQGDEGIEFSNDLILGTFELTGKQPERKFSKRFRVQEPFQWIGLNIESMGSSTLKLKKVSLTPLIKAEQ